MTVPATKWLKDYKAMERLFCAHHPPKSLRNERGLFKNFFNILKANFPQYENKILHLTTRVFSWFRIRTINKLAKFKKKAKKEPKVIAKQKKTKNKSGPITLRGKIQLAARSH